MTKGLQATLAKLVLFSLVTIATTTYLAAIIGNFRLFAEPFEVQAEFSDATGLLKGDVVKAAGVTVGRVDRIEIRDGIALVTMSIDEGTELPGDLGAQIRFRNLVGQRMVTFVPTSSATGSRMEDGAMIPLDRTEAAFDLSELFNGLRPLIRSTSPQDINIVTRELVAALKGRSDEVARLFDNLAAVSEVVATRDRELEQLLHNLSVVTGDLAARDAKLRQTLADLNSFLAEIAATSADLEAALSNLDDAAQRLGEIVRVNDELIRREVEDLAAVLDAVNDRRSDLRAAVRRLPEFAVAVERVTQYGEWASQHLIHVCKDDFGTCGKQGTP